MSKRNLMLIVLLFSFTGYINAQAETPNIEPGEWETTSSITMEGPFPIPPQEDTNTQCVTQEDIDEGMAFMDDDENCEVIERDIKRDRMSVTMTCETGEAMTMTMKMDMEFDGDSMEGQMVGDMESPMGAMKMNVAMSGKRIGDC